MESGIQSKEYYQEEKETLGMYDLRLHSPRKHKNLNMYAPNK